MKKFIILLLCFNIFSMPLYALIEDDFIENSLDKNLKIKNYKYVPYEDELFEKSNNTVKIKVRIKEKYTTKNKELFEGDNIEFVTLDDVTIKNNLYPQGSVVKARLETVSPNYTYGVPADFVIGNFTLDKYKLSGEISKTGANRSLWVYPAVYATSILFGLGLLFIFVRGGHAKISPSETFVLEAKQ